MNLLINIINVIHFNIIKLYCSFEISVFLLMTLFFIHTSKFTEDIHLSCGAELNKNGGANETSISLH